MIGPGSMPRYLPRFRGLKSRPLLYSRRRRANKPRKKEAGAQRADIEIVAFDHGPPEFPVATLRPRDSGSHAHAALGALQRWFLARWTWFKPRAMPCIVAALGMMAVISSADYLAHHLDQPTPAPKHQVVVGIGR